MRLRRIATAASALAIASVGTFAGVAASSASAAPRPPTVIHTTSVLNSDTRLGSRVEVLRYTEYTQTRVTPGFARFATLLEVCISLGRPAPTPLVTAARVVPTPTSSLVPNAICNWRMTRTGPAPHAFLNGSAVRNGLGQVGRVTGGGFTWLGALGPNGGFVAQNVAPKTQLDTFVFSTP